MSVQGGSAVGLPARADKLAPEIAFPRLRSQAWSGILLCSGHVSIAVCPFQGFHNYFFIRPSNGRQEKKSISPNSRPELLPRPPYSHLSHSHLHPYLPEEKSLFCHKTTRSHPSGTRAHGSLLPLQETTFSNHVVIYGAQSWVFTRRAPCWQVAAEPYTSDGLKPLPISCLNAFGASLYLCSCAKGGA